MKINQVADLVDITKKNIRFYEDQGLVDPERDPANGYREYTLKDAEELRKIKLLRQLGVSIDNIRKLQKGEMDLDRCMQNRLKELDTEGETLEHMKSICRLISDENEDISGLDATLYLNKMKDIEKGGVRFMNVKMSDVKKRKTGAIIAAAAVVLFALAMIAIMIWANSVDPAPGVLAFMIVIFGAIIVGVLIALWQRLKEVEGGEQDEAYKY